MLSPQNILELPVKVKLFYLDWFGEKMQNILDKVISMTLNKYVF